MSGFTLGRGSRPRCNWKDKFKVLASDTLNATNDRFLQLAATRFKASEQETSATLEKKVVAIDETVKPMKESLQKVSDHLHALEVERKVAYGELMKVADLSMRGTQHLVQALQSPTTRGEWGEMQLRRILEMTGMAEHAHDFKAQMQIDSDEGRLIPDFVVHLPGDRAVAFDSKAPMDAYWEFQRCADDPQQQKLLLAEHAKQVKDRIRKLGKKEYWKQIETTPGVVVLFMPGENLLRTALENDPDLIRFLE